MLTNQTGYGLIGDELSQIANMQNNAKTHSYNLKVSMKKQGLTGENTSDGKKKFLTNHNSVLIDPSSVS
jgi:hypothetical protein